MTSPPDATVADETIEDEGEPTTPAAQPHPTQGLTMATATAQNGAIVRVRHLRIANHYRTTW